MAKSRASRPGSSPTPKVSALGTALDALTQSVTALTPGMQSLASGVSGASGGGKQTAYPFVDLTGTATAPPEEVETDGDRKKREKTEAKAKGDAEKAKKKEEDEKAKQLSPLEKAAGHVEGFANGLQSIASMGGQPAAAVNAVGGQVAKLTTNLPTLGKAIGDMVGGQIGGSISSLAGKFGPYAAAVGQFIDTAAGLPQLFKSAADSASNYVGAFAPMASERYSRAWQDLTASIGEVLLPVLNAATDVVRFFGDTIAGLTPVVRPLVDFAMRMVRPFALLAGDVFRELVTVGALLVDAFTPLIELMVEMSVGPLRMLAEGMRAVVKVITDVTRAVGGFLGLKVPNFNGASYGKSAQTPEWSDTTAAWKKLVESTANQGQAATEERVPTLLENIKTALDGLPAKFAAELAGVMNRGGQAVNQVVNGSVQAFARGEGLGPVIEHLGNLMRPQVLKRS